MIIHGHLSFCSLEVESSVQGHYIQTTSGLASCQEVPTEKRKEKKQKSVHMTIQKAKIGDVCVNMIGEMDIWSH